ncbi:hypothetical protein EJ04DRAFT_543613 [Polyplosphaeria fusca]|uniref:Uncharacterized protein n=1 Tax=Polyplosphaeria fusca TaxID=682080 RepID=A0A9P4QX99_9PLEO|nr:hypothetical protein EJ04DRAFT_543613 [Polyplosphaeria fusca]
MFDYAFYPPEESLFDPFAQTAGTDNLFYDDDFTPVAEPVVEQNPVEAVDSPAAEVDMAPVGGLAKSQHVPRGPANGNHEGGRGGASGRTRRGGRGRGRGRSGMRGEPPQEAQMEKESDQKQTPEEPSQDAETEEQKTTGPPAPSAPREKTTHAARGDRTLTGGPKRTRLTEEEMKVKMEAMRSKNDSLAQAHARAQADAANYQAHEALLAQKDAEHKKHLKEREKEDRKNRQQMMGERERNRQRKLDAQKGREWDFEKEDGFAGTGEERRRGAARGAYGGVAPNPRQATAQEKVEGWVMDQETPDLPHPPPSTRGGRGRGGRGARGGRGDRGGARGGGRGDHHANHHATPSNKEQAPPSAADFPELPQAIAPAADGKDVPAPKKLDFPIRNKPAQLKTAETDDARPGVKKQDSFGLSPAAAGSSWADQVEGLKD